MSLELKPMEELEKKNNKIDSVGKIIKALEKNFFLLSKYY